MKFIRIATLCCLFAGCGVTSYGAAERDARARLLSTCGSLVNAPSTALVPSTLEVASVSPLHGDVPQGRLVAHPLVGARIVVRAEPGLTAQWLDRVVSCQLGRNGEAGEVDVREGRADFIVELRATDRHDATSLLDQARALRQTR